MTRNALLENTKAGSASFSIAMLLNTVRMTSALAKRRFLQLDFERKKMARIRVICDSTVLSDQQKVTAVLAVINISPPTNQ